jgi:hypothetical protein
MIIFEMGSTFLLGEIERRNPDILQPFLRHVSRRSLAWRDLELCRQGTFHGLLLALERLFTRRHDSGIPPHRSASALRMSLVFTLVTLEWLLFKLPRFGDSLLYISSIFGNWNLPLIKINACIIVIYSIPVAALHFFHLWAEGRTADAKWDFTPLAYGTMLFLVAVNSGVGGDFIYFQFYSCNGNPFRDCFLRAVPGL